MRDASPDLKARLKGADWVVSYCVKDFRGFEMAKYLAEQGVPHSVILRPYGIKGWIAEGLPVTGAKALSGDRARKALLTRLAQAANGDSPRTAAGGASHAP
jgi:hypothetical protein